MLAGMASDIAQQVLRTAPGLEASVIPVLVDRAVSEEPLDQLVRLARGVAEHHPLVARADPVDRVDVAVLRLPRLVHALRDVRGLRVDGDGDAARVGVEAVLGARVADARDPLPNKARDVDVRLGRDLAGNDHEPRRDQRLARHPAERIALEDDYFVSKKLYPNVDFYSGIVQKALGIPTSMFTCIFALARTVGWITQWEEMITDPEYKIGRPRQLYTGAARRDVPSIEQRP